MYVSVSVLVSAYVSMSVSVSMHVSVSVSVHVSVSVSVPVSAIAGEQILGFGEVLTSGRLRLLKGLKGLGGSGHPATKPAWLQLGRLPSSLE